MTGTGSQNASGPLHGNRALRKKLHGTLLCLEDVPLKNISTITSELP